MRVALLADTHLPRGARRLPDLCLDLLRESDVVVHAGDFSRLSALEDLRRLATRLEGVHGNADEPAVRAILPGRTVVEVDGLRIGVVHDAGPAVGRHDRLRASFPGCHVLVYGHTHVPELVHSEGVWIVNPGSPTERRRAPVRAMAVIEDGRPRLVHLS